MGIDRTRIVPTRHRNRHVAARLSKALALTTSNASIEYIAQPPIRYDNANESGYDQRTCGQQEGRV